MVKIVEIAKDTFTGTATVATAQTFTFSFANIVTPSVIKSIIVMLQPPTPPASIDFEVKIRRGTDQYTLINQVGYSNPLYTNEEVPFYLDENCTGGSIVLTAPIGTVVTVIFTGVIVPATSSYNSLGKISGTIGNLTFTGTTPQTILTNVSSEYYLIKSIALALKVPLNVTIDIMYSDFASSTVPIKTITFFGATSSSQFSYSSPSWNYLLPSGATLNLFSTFTGVDCDYFVHYTV